jgi:hypothetical protein
MLAKNPDARPQTMAVVGKALEQILRTLDGSPTDAPTLLPIPQTLPASMTLDGSLFMTSAGARPGTRRLSFVFGGLAAAVALAAITAALVILA